MRIAVRMTMVVISLLAGVLTAGAASAAPATGFIPYTTPAAAVSYRYVGGPISCDSGYACAILDTSDGNHNWVFKFYYYNTYRLSYWHGSGSAYNHQTGGAAMRILDVNGRQLVCVPAGADIPVNWDPAWFIRLTPSPC
jgi:hypothetical protein